MVDRFRVTTLKELAEVQRAEELLKSNNSEDNTPQFTPEEAAVYLEMYLSDQARWRLCHGPFKEYLKPGPYFVEEEEDTLEVRTMGEGEEEIQVSELESEDLYPDDEELQEVANAIYKQIVLDWRYDPMLLDICRKGKLTRKMVRDAVDSAADTIVREIEEEGFVTPYSKSLNRSMQRVIGKLGEEVLKKGFSDFDAIVGTGVSYPHRVSLFLRSKPFEKTATGSRVGSTPNQQETSTTRLQNRHWISSKRL